MSTLELTKKIESLSANDFDMVVMLVNRLYGETDGLKKLSGDEIVEELLDSAQRSDAGFTKPVRTASSEMRSKYAI